MIYLEQFYFTYAICWSASGTVLEVKAEVPNDDHNTQSISNKLSNSRLLFDMASIVVLLENFKVCYIFNYSSKLLQTFFFLFSFSLEKKILMPEAADEPFVFLQKYFGFSTLQRSTVSVLTSSQRPLLISDDVRTFWIIHANL